MPWYNIFAGYLIVKCTNILYIVDCQWGNWIHGECSKTCGGGVQTNHREKITEELFGGDPCQGEETEEMECNVQECCK